MFRLKHRKNGALFVFIVRAMVCFAFICILDKDNWLLRRVSNYVSKSKKTKWIVSERIQRIICNQYREEGKFTYKVHFYVTGEHAGNITDDVTLLTQLNTRRFYMLKAILNRWKGPLSAALYVESHEVGNITQRLLAISRPGLQFHIVEKKGMYYPVNFLRNVAMAGSNTNYIFNMDIDFLPIQDMHRIFAHYIKAGLFQGYRLAAVVPAFKMINEAHIVPRLRSELLKQWEKNLTVPYSEFGFPDGHRSTNYERWKNSSKPYELLRNNLHSSFEPYVLINRKLSPPYNQTFIHRYYDKVVYTDILITCKFKFVVLPNVFIVHRLHSKESMEFSRTIYKCANENLLRYREWLIGQPDLFYRQIGRT